MRETDQLVIRAQSGDTEAFDGLVRRFQNAAVVYAAARLRGDVDLAEDAAQDAFVEAYRDLPALREPTAFPAWLRRIVLKQCDRRTRRRQPDTLPLDDAVTAPAADDPLQAVVRRELRESVRTALQSLSPGERAVSCLFYIGGYSHREIACFLSLPATTVKSRLHTARIRLKEGLLSMLQDDLQQLRPSNTSHFAARVREQVTRALAAMVRGDGAEEDLRRHHPRARYRDPHPVFHLCASLIGWAISVGAREVHLAPDAAGWHVLFDAGGERREVLSLPPSLGEAVIARLKDSATLDVEERTAPQEGVIPVAALEGTYTVVVSTAPTPGSEQVTLRISCTEMRETPTLPSAV
jgi:RNA polymerase sigma factor (sigma-70 family)